MPTVQNGRVSIDIAAPPGLVYDLIADVTRMSEWSPECYRCEWLDGAPAPAGGRGFVDTTATPRFSLYICIDSRSISPRIYRAWHVGHSAIRLSKVCCLTFDHGSM